MLRSRSSTLEAGACAGVAEESVAAARLLAAKEETGSDVGVALTALALVEDNQLGWAALCTDALPACATGVERATCPKSDACGAEVVPVAVSMPCSKPARLLSSASSDVCADCRRDCRDSMAASFSRRAATASPLKQTECKDTNMHGQAG